METPNLDDVFFAMTGSPVSAKVDQDSILEGALP
jgi:hypothetical protein